MAYRPLAFFNLELINSRFLDSYIAKCQVHMYASLIYHRLQGTDADQAVKKDLKRVPGASRSGSQIVSAQIWILAP